MNYRINITYSKRASDLSDFLENVVSSYCHRTSVNITIFHKKCASIGTEKMFSTYFTIINRNVHCRARSVEINKT